MTAPPTPTPAEQHPDSDSISIPVPSRSDTEPAPTGRAVFFGTDLIAGQDTATFDDRAGRCYELAAAAIAWGAAGETATLVHGTIRSATPPARIPHAWLLLDDGTLWEPVTANVYQADEWVTWADARPDELYPTATRVRVQLHEHAHYGPWAEDDDSSGGRDSETPA